MGIAFGRRGSLTDYLSDSDIVELHKTIGSFVIQFPLLHCEECTSALSNGSQNAVFLESCGAFRLYELTKILF